MTNPELDNLIIKYLLIGGAIGFILASIIWAAAVLDFRELRKSLTDGEG